MPSVLTWLAAMTVKLFAWSYRLEVSDPFGMVGRLQRESFVAAIWHNRLLFSAPLMPRAVRERFSVLISQSRDGGYVARFVRYFQLEAVRGSSSRGGGQALFELFKVLENGRSVVLTVDGPRGPKYSVHPGAVTASRHTGRPIVPIVVNAPRKWQLHSWDGLQVPVPFSRVRMVIGEPYLPAETRTVPEACEELRTRLAALTED